MNIDRWTRRPAQPPVPVPPAAPAAPSNGEPHPAWPAYAGFAAPGEAVTPWTQPDASPMLDEPQPFHGLSFDVPDAAAAGDEVDPRMVAWTQPAVVAEAAVPQPQGAEAFVVPPPMLEAPVVEPPNDPAAFASPLVEATVVPPALPLPLMAPVLPAFEPEPAFEQVSAFEPVRPFEPAPQLVPERVAEPLPEPVAAPIEVYPAEPFAAPVGEPLVAEVVAEPVPEPLLAGPPMVELVDSPYDPDPADEMPADLEADLTSSESAAPAAAADQHGTTWVVDAGVAMVQPRSASEVLGTLARKVAHGAVEQYQPVPLGFTPLDKTIGGGLRAGELLLIGGAQGTGKTTMAVQMARNIVLGGQASVLYICFEHDEEYLLNRIIAMESVLSHLPQKTTGVKLQDVRREILGTWLAQGTEHADLSTNPRLRPALERIGRYGQNLYLLRGSQTTSTIQNMHELVARYKELSGDRRLVVFVDYMQKVPVIPEPNTETEKVTSIVNGLKDLALSMDVPMISIVAADKEGLKASRLRNHHLRGSSAINYEADIILILNEKYNIVAKVNIEFNPYQAQRFRDWVICSIEKNRGGQNSVDLEYQKHFEFSCFDANGRTVQEKLIEERLYND